MTSITQSLDLQAAREIVQSDDVALLAHVARLMQFDDDSLIETHADAKSFVHAQRAETERRIEREVLDAQITQAILRHRIQQRGARAIAHDRYRVELVCKPVVVKRFDVLRQLVGKVPDDELSGGKQPALSLVQRDPEWVAHAGKLKALAGKYGGEIKEIVETGIVYEDGPAALVIELREQPKAVNA